MAALLPVVLLLPFINKAIHIDDTVYMLVAQHIVSSPFDYFGFQMNWTGDLDWVHSFNKNPPGLSYYLAAWGVIFGWSEVSMHTAMLIPTSLASLGIYRLAELLCGRPLLATILAVCTPGFLVSCSNVMCEAPMLACYVWCVVWWVRGAQSGSQMQLALGALLLGVGVLVKFVVITALPLLMIYTVWKERRVTRKHYWFLIPVAMLMLYDLSSWVLYDKSFILDIVAFSTFHASSAPQGSMVKKTFVALAFAGGLYLPALLVSLWSETRSVLIGVTLVLLAFVGYVFIRGGIDDSYMMYGLRGVRWGFVAHQVIFTVAGVYMFMLGALQLWKAADADTILLCSLIGGIFVFGGFVNWSVNARALLPMVPAVAIVIVRRIEALESVRMGRVGEVMLVTMAVVLSLAVGYGDYTFAGASRSFAADIHEEMQNVDGTVWYDGHLGFQWYMHRAGYQALDFYPSSDDDTDEEQINGPENVLEVASPGDVLIGWQNANLMKSPPGNRIDSMESYSYPGSSLASTFDSARNTGFYGKPTILLPYRLGQAPPQRFRVYHLK